jgi:hypothetical protein
MRLALPDVPAVGPVDGFGEMLQAVPHRNRPGSSGAVLQPPPGDSAFKAGADQQPGEGLVLAAAVFQDLLRNQLLVDLADRHEMVFPEHRDSGLQDGLSVGVASH